MLGGESPLSRSSWSRRTREAPGRHREVGSEGSVERRCGARDTNRIGGVVQPGRVGTPPRSPPSTMGRTGYIRRLCPDGMTADRGRSARGPGLGLRVEESSLSASPTSADGIVPPATVGRPERWRGVVVTGGVARWQPARRWPSGSTPGMNGPLARWEPTPRLGGVYHPDVISRPAGDVTRLSGGVGGGRP
jgi:hypothetical protein